MRMLNVDSISFSAVFLKPTFSKGESKYVTVPRTELASLLVSCPGLNYPNVYPLA